MSDQTSPLRTLLGNRLFQVLAVIMALLAIYIEAVTAWKVTNEARGVAADTAAKTAKVVEPRP